jgi:cytochrome c-type biogenesis protein CcsB
VGLSVEGLSSATFWLALIGSALSSLLYLGRLLGVRLALRRLATSAGGGPVVATLEESGNGWANSPVRAATFAASATLVLLGVSLLARWRAVGHAPWSNMYEFTVSFAAAILLFHVAFERLYPQRSPVRSRAAQGAVPERLSPGALALPLVFGMLAMAAAFFPSGVRPLVPALQNSDLLAIHVAAMILAYGALSVSFAAAVLYLVQACPEPGRRGGKRNRFARLPTARALDELAFKSVMVGFPLLAAGIALGAYWANSAWGRYWGWDPKETSALVTWLIYGIYLHMRGLRGWSGTRSAVVLVAGFGAVLFTYFAVNLWVSGLHSYAGV